MIAKNIPNSIKNEVGLRFKKNAKVDPANPPIPPVSVPCVRLLICAFSAV
jgi:hypothetical protein